MKIDERVLEVCAEAIRKVEVIVGFDRSDPPLPYVDLVEDFADETERYVIVKTCIEAYLKETQPTAEVEPSCDVVERVARVLCRQWYVSEGYAADDLVIPLNDYIEKYWIEWELYAKAALSTLQQKPKAEVNELVGEINEEINIHDNELWEDEEDKHKAYMNAIFILEKCKNFIEGK
jgi:hypothetical protein